VHRQRVRFRQIDGREAGLGFSMLNVETL